MSTALEERIAYHEAALRELRQQQRAEQHAAFLLDILRVTEGWFTVIELIGLARDDPALSAQLAGRSPKQIGKRLRAISEALASDGQLRLLRHDTNGAALWKVHSE